MAVNMIKLSSSQQQMVNKIIDAGKKAGVSDVVIQAAVNIANAESNFDPTQKAITTSASGMFQYIDSTWNSAWNSFVKTNPTNSLASKSADAVRFDSDAQIAIMYQDLNRWYAGYDQGQLAKNYMPGGNLYSQVQQLANNGIDITSNFINYAYFRHNTSVSETTTVIKRDFTPTNLATINSLVAGQNSQLRSSYSVSADGAVVTINTLDGSGGLVRQDIQYFTDGTQSTLSKEVTVVTDGIKKTATTISYNPGIANGSCTVSTKVDTNGDGKWDQFSVGADTNNDGVLDQAVSSGTTQSTLFTADKQLDALHDQGLVNNDIWNDYTSWSTSQLVNSSMTAPVTTTSDLYSPIGAFYESKSAGKDPALSIKSAANSDFWQAAA